MNLNQYEQCFNFTQNRIHKKKIKLNYFSKNLKTPNKNNKKIKNWVKNEKILKINLNHYVQSFNFTPKNNS